MFTPGSPAAQSLSVHKKKKRKLPAEQEQQFRGNRRKNSKLTKSCNGACGPRPKCSQTLAWNIALRPDTTTPADVLPLRPKGIVRTLAYQGILTQISYHDDSEVCQTFRRSEVLVRTPQSDRYLPRLYKSHNQRVWVYKRTYETIFVRGKSTLSSTWVSWFCVQSTTTCIGIVHGRSFIHSPSNSNG